jgi:hypothetical protein
MYIQLQPEFEDILQSLGSGAAEFFGSKFIPGMALTVKTTFADY